MMLLFFFHVSFNLPSFYHSLGRLLMTLSLLTQI